MFLNSMEKSKKNFFISTYFKLNLVVSTMDDHQIGDEKILMAMQRTDLFSSHSEIVIAYLACVH